MEADQPRLTVTDIDLMPYSRIVGQEDLKLALELAFIAPRIGGVLISGQRGTAKSTTARAFARLAYDRLPVTLPINATDDRVLGGWRIDELMKGHAETQPGLLEEAGESGFLYVDEVNLLDDHLVNLILDASSTGVLTIQRDAIDRQREVSFLLVGTMNPEEGGLRPQLLDRFGVMVTVAAERDRARRRAILEAVLAYDEARATGNRQWIEEGLASDTTLREKLDQARGRVYDVVVDPMIGPAALLAQEFETAGHRADYVMLLAARAYASLRGDPEVDESHLTRVAKLALQHRRPVTTQGGRTEWGRTDDDRVTKALGVG
jgi:magnesium chelatase subunit I